MSLNLTIKKYLFAGLFLGVTISPSHAFFPLISDDTGTQGKGGNQLEFDYVFERQTNGALEIDGVALGEDNSVGNFLLSTYTRGLTDNLDIFLGVSRQLSSTSGWNNTELGLKWVFAGDQSEGWRFAAKPRVILPVSKNMQKSDLGHAKTNGGLTLIGSYLTEGAELHLNAGYTSNRSDSLNEEPSQRTNLWSMSVAPVWVMNDQWKLALDLGLQTNPDKNSQYIGLAEVAMVYSPVKNLQLGLGVITSPTINGQRTSRGMTVTTGLTWQF